MQNLPWANFRARLAKAAVLLAIFAAGKALCAGTNDALIDLLIKKGIISQDEAVQVQAEAATQNTNNPPPPPPSKWIIGNAISTVELFGDIRLRYEHRQADTPANGRLGLERERYALRLGLRGDAADGFYYGFRLETAANPRSPWVTFGTSSQASGVNSYQGPYGKSGAGLNVGEIYLGWHPVNWLDFTVGKMPMPLYTTPMVWDSDINPEGAAEHFNYTVGELDAFATFTQFLYQDFNPEYASVGLVAPGSLTGTSGDSVYQIAWQGGVTWHMTTNISAKIAGTLYNYIGLANSGDNYSIDNNSALEYFNGPFVGEGAYVGTQTPVNGSSGFGNPALNNSAYGFDRNFPLNQVGINDLKIIDVPFQLDAKFKWVDTRVFGDVAYNLEGKQRAEKAQAAYASYLQNYTAGIPTIQAFSPQTDDVHAYQFGLAIASTNSLGLVYGNTCHRNAWEIRSYWQHVEQYALDPNLLDSDFFEGRGNLQGIYVAVGYGLGENVIGTVRYGNADIINKKLGTGGSNQDIPQVNPIEHYNLLQLDLTMRF